MFFSPWADLHQWNGRAREEDSKQQEGLASPNIWQRSDKRSAEEGQQALRGQREKREQERMWVACLAHKSPKKAVSSRIMSVNNDNQKRRDTSFCPLKTVQVRLKRFTSALVSYSESNWKTSQCRVHSVNQSVNKKNSTHALQNAMQRLQYQEVLVGKLTFWPAAAHKARKSKKVTLTPWMSPFMRNVCWGNVWCNTCRINTDKRWNQLYHKEHARLQREREKKKTGRKHNGS